MPSFQGYRTPPWLYNLLYREFGPFQLDAWASDKNHLCDRYFTEETDGFASEWPTLDVFGNPPFARSGEAVEKAYKHSAMTNRVSCILLQAGISTVWFHTYATAGTVLIPNCRINYWLSQEEKIELVRAAKAAGKPAPKFGGFNRDSLIVLFGPEHWEGGIKPYYIRDLRKDVPHEGGEPSLILRPSNAGSEMR